MSETNVLALVRGNERYIFLYEDADRADCLRKLGSFASRAELSFTWYDAAVLSQRIREIENSRQTNNRLENLP